MTFKKGKSGNPKGRPKLGNTTKEALENAIKKVQKKKRVRLLDHFVERALNNDAVLITLIKKFIPDMQHVQADVDIKEIIIKWAKQESSK